MSAFFHRVERFIKDWTLLIAIILGAGFHKFFGYIEDRFDLLMPTLIFIMLFLSFSKLEGFEGKKAWWHVLVVLIQIAVGTSLYFLILPYDAVLAAGISLCVLVSPATSSPVVVNLMKGNIEFSTEFLLLDSVVAAIILPFWMAYAGGDPSIDIVETIKDIAEHTLVVVLVPLFAALLIRKAIPKSKEVVKRFSFLSYYLWAVALMILMGTSTDMFLSQPDPDYKFAIESLLLTTVVCFILIMGGKFLGGDRLTGIAAGQALGQKNTVLAVWLASGFMNPLSALVPTMWIVSQNIINSVQLWNANRKN